VETPYLSRKGKQAARRAYGGAGLGCRKKRRPFCNGADTGFNVTRHESEQTSDWCLFAREYGERLKRGKQTGDGGDSTTRLCTPSSGFVPELVSTMVVSQRLPSCKDNRAGLGSAFEVLEPYAGKLARTVLRGAGGP
jgi:hypothetical protein